MCTWVSAHDRNRMGEPGQFINSLNSKMFIWTQRSVILIEMELSIILICFPEHMYHNQSFPVSVQFLLKNNNGWFSIDFIWVVCYVNLFSSFVNLTIFLFSLIPICIISTTTEPGSCFSLNASNSLSRINTLAFELKVYPLAYFCTEQSWLTIST